MVVHQVKSLKQAWANYGWGAICGPLSSSIWPLELEKMILSLFSHNIAGTCFQCFHWHLNKEPNTLVVLHGSVWFWEILGGSKS